MHQGEHASMGSITQAVAHGSERPCASGHYTGQSAEADAPPADSMPRMFRRRRLRYCEYGTAPGESGMPMTGSSAESSIILGGLPAGTGRGRAPSASTFPACAVSEGCLVCLLCTGMPHIVPVWHTGNLMVGFHAVESSGKTRCDAASPHAGVPNFANASTLGRVVLSSGAATEPLDCKGNCDQASSSREHTWKVPRPNSSGSTFRGPIGLPVAFPPGGPPRVPPTHQGSPHGIWAAGGGCLASFSCSCTRMAGENVLP